MDNISDVIQFLKQAKEKQKVYIKKKTPVKDRIKTYVFFLDYAAAFDTIRRDQITDKLKDKLMNR